MVSVAHTSSECICENEWERMCVVDLYNDHVKSRGEVKAIKRNKKKERK